MSRIAWITKAVASSVVALVASTAFPASAGTAGFGPGIEPPSSYDGQDTCSPAAKPGVLAFQRMVLSRYPWTGDSGISRACTVGGQSEHKEGRAWDWRVNVGIASQRAAAKDLIDRLLKEDRYGNDAALARRLGVMYMIWNRRIWFPWGGWQTYCVQKSWGCHSPGERDAIRSPHTDHVHFSFTWDGAMRRTTYYRPTRSLVAAMSSPSLATGALVAARNGGISPLNVGFYGSQSGRALKHPLVATAVTPSGYGYYLAFANGRVRAFGDARYRGAAANDIRAAAIAVSPTGKGYWLVSRRGQVRAFGNVPDAGGLAGKADSPIVGMAPTPTGAGYWLVTKAGRVAAFGDARFLGGLAGDTEDARGIVATATGEGYWVFTAKGRVAAFGDAPSLGGVTDQSDHAVVGMARTPSGLGYWLVGELGNVWEFGDAPVLGSGRTMFRSATPPAPPAGAVPDLLPRD